MRNSAYQENHPYNFLTALMTALVNGLALSVVYVPIFDVVLNALRNIEAIDVNKRWGDLFQALRDRPTVGSLVAGISPDPHLDSLENRFLGDLSWLVARLRGY